MSQAPTPPVPSNRWSAALSAFRDWPRDPARVAGAAAAAASGDPYRAALEGLPDPVLIVDGGAAEDLSARRILFANAAARDLLKASGRGSRWWRPCATRRRLRRSMARSTAASPMKRPMSRPGPQERFWRISASPLAVEAGSARQAVVRFRDETDALRMERMRADFLANASHELKTPLASLQGFIETLKGHARDDERARDRFLDIMAAQTARMSRMIADLLALSRIELAEHISPSGRADVALAAGDVIDALAPLLTDLDAQIDLSVRTRPALIVGDRDQVIQVIQNLTENAVRYSPPGRRVELVVEGGLGLTEAQAPTRREASRLTLLTPDREADARYVVVRVIDQGHGLARDQLPRLTERFYRVEGQKSGQSPGTGLGLSIVKHIVNRHRGGMMVESQPDVGTTFTVYFPMPGGSAT
jgi:two-component system phosphate regulon sensor histidine kinase PhoR